MRSPLDLIKGEFDHALFTTYTCNLMFFERWVVPLLGNAGVRNVTLFADAGQLGAALADRHVQLAGRLYHVHGVTARGVFHSKLILLISPKQARLCVSSANLTVSGQLRNLEIAVAFDSTIPEHQGVIAAAGEYFRRLATEAPMHIAEAVFDALTHVTDADTAGSAHFIHNLDSLLVDKIPRGPLRAVAPFADRTAAGRLAGRGALTFMVDGDNFAASEDFFTGEWAVEPRRFDRSLHGKAFWHAGGGWAMIGSPNLTDPALLRPSDAGNYETAVEFTDLPDGFPEPPSSSWDGDNIEVVAPRRAASTAPPSVHKKSDPLAFSAWEDDGYIAVTGVPDGIPIQYGSLNGWRDLGTVESGKLLVPDEVRPHLLRAAIGARIALAVVHRVGELRIRRTRRPHTQSTRTLTGTLPLDPEGQRTLEQVLGDLFALASLVHEERSRTPLLAPTRPAEPAVRERLSEWLPAHPEDEPRIPDLYHRAWAERRPVDVLLALARTALRLDDLENTIPSIGADEQAVSAELRDIDDRDDEDETPGEQATTDDAPPPTTRDILNRYRKAFMHRLDELVKFTATVDDQDLADLAFQVTLIQHERLTLEVRIDEEPVPLVEPKALLQQKLPLIAAYLNRDGDDPLCMETVRYHLAECLRTDDVWTALEREKLEGLAYTHGRRILDTPLPNRPVDGLLGMDLDQADGWIEDFTARTDWTAITGHAAEYLENVGLHLDPFPHITGLAEYSEISHAPGREGSPAWEVIGYGAIAGLADDNPYGMAAANTGDGGYYVAHVLVAAPAEMRLYEAVRRRADQAWLWRYYKPVGRKVLEDTAKYGPTALSDTYREPFHDAGFDGLPDPVRPVAARLFEIVESEISQS